MAGDGPDEPVSIPENRTPETEPDVSARDRPTTDDLRDDLRADGRGEDDDSIVDDSLLEGTDAPAENLLDPDETDESDDATGRLLDETGDGEEGAAGEDAFTAATDPAPAAGADDGSPAGAGSGTGDDAGSTAASAESANVDDWTPAGDSEASGDEGGGGQDVAGATATERDRPVPVGVKFGSTRTVIALPDGDGGMRTVRTLSCVATYDDPLTGEQRLLYGDEAAAEYPDRAEFMLRSGLPEDDERAELAGRFFEAVVRDFGVPEHSAVVYAVPGIENEAGLSNLESIITDSDIGDALVRDFPEALCGAVPAIGNGLDALEGIFVTVNLGSTNLEVTAFRRGERFVHHSTGAVTGNGVDREIVENVEAETQGRVRIDRTTAREYKEDHADFEAYDPFTAVVQQPGGGAHRFTIEDSVMDAVDAYLDDVVEEVADEFLPELAGESLKVYELALDRPLVLTGGMACVPGIVEEFRQRLGQAVDREVAATSSNRPDLAAAGGAHLIAHQLVDRDAS